ncbi:tripartite tricarboxylate transporter substrate binding protein [Bordetella sp. N]|uniref:Bug family tripartite tricarboxylate transporter substrate binding protein n=1 Tax=Bordetella sp. N TaxID=1746199 RepID=UPI00070A40B4|nr:tripartite tricarboxylate transporter substrate binding protein [Bordetella sp. N]ALM86156.1 hypothetical protein ASB57_27245 [Bordetella sp. N]
MFVFLFAGAAPARAGFPDKPIYLVVPYATGGFVHLVGMLLGEAMGDALGKNIVVTNQPGANGLIGAGYVAKAAPDGYTVLLAASSILEINPHIYKSVPFDALKDFAPVGLVANTSNILVVSPESGIKSLKDLVAKARTAPDQVSYGSSGPGSVMHIAGEALQRSIDKPMMHVPYKGTAPALTDLMGGRITTLFSDSSAIPQIQSGKLVALAVSPATIPQLPGVPAMKDAAQAAGIPDYHPPVLWYGLLAPRNVPAPIIAKLNAALVKALNTPALRQKLIDAGATPAADPSAAYLARQLPLEYADYGKLLSQLNIKLD